MGIDKLLPFLRKHAPGGVSEISVSSLAGRTAYIDASISIYQWFHVGESRKIYNSEGKPINHLQGLFYRTARLCELGITPIYVFDGKPPEAKAGVIKKRKERGGKRINSQIFEECRELLKLMGVQYVDSVSEAEATASKATLGGGFVITEDTDALAFGAKEVLFGFDLKSKLCTMVKLDQCLVELRLSYPEFVDMCIMFGSDYTECGIPKVGPATAYQLIQEHRNIEAIVAALENTPPPGFTYQEARREFLEAKVTAVERIQASPHTKDSINIIYAYLVLTFGLKSNKIAKTLASFAESRGVSI